MKRFPLCRNLMMSLALLVGSATLSAQSFQDEAGVLNYTVTGSNTVSVGIVSTGYSGAVEVPAQVTNDGNTYTVTAITQGGFNNSQMSSITLPGTITFIANQGFARMKNIKTITIPKSVTEIANEAFAYNESSNGLQSIIFEEGIKLNEIKNHTFKNCQHVVSFEIPEGVSAIGEWALEGMSAMTSLTLPSTLRTLGSGAVYNCKALESLTIRAFAPPAAQSNTFNNVPFSSCTLTVPDVAVNDYKNNAVFSQFANIKGENMGEPVGFPAAGKTIDGLKYSLNADGETLTVSVADKNAAFNAVIAQAIEHDGTNYTVTAISAQGFQGSKITGIVIPEGVTTIGNQAFENAKGITSVTIPASVAKIGDAAFRYGEGLLSVTFAEGESQLKAIPNHMFSGCQKIAGTIDVPEGVTAIGEYAFEKCYGVENYVLPSTLKTIATGAFRFYDNNPGSLKTISIKATVPPTVATEWVFSGVDKTTVKLIVPTASVSAYQTAPNYGFTNVEGDGSQGEDPVGPGTFPETGVTDGTLLFTLNGDGKTVTVSLANKGAEIDVNIPATLEYLEKEYPVTEIAQSGFQQAQFTGVIIPNGITKIGASAFENSKKFTAITIPASVEEIGNAAFQWCEGLQSIVIEKGSKLTAINDHTFKGANKVKELTIPEGVTTIGEWVFENMSAMSALTLPASLESLGSGALARCPSLTFLTVKATNPPATKDNTFDSFPFATCGLYVPQSALSTYKSTAPWSNFGTITDGEYTTFTSGDFTYAVKSSSEVLLMSAAPGITTANIPDQVTNGGNTYKVVTIGGSVFAGSAITSVTLPSTLKSIGQSAFKECKQLTAITLPEGLETIGDYAFQDAAITKIIMPNTVTSVGVKSLPRDLQELELSKGLTSIPEQMAMYTRITDLAIPEGVTSIGREAFFSNSMLENVTLPSTLSSIEYQAFGNSPKIVSVVCAASVPPTVNSDNVNVTFSSEVYKNATLVVPEGTATAYESVEPWASFANIVDRTIITSDEFEVDGIRYGLINRSTARVIGLTNDMATALYIPNAVKYNESFVNVVEIGANALANYSFTSVEIAPNVAEICSGAFAAVPLTSVKAYALEAPVCADNAFAASVYANATLYVGAQCSDSYKAASGWKNFQHIVEEVEVGNIFTIGDFTYTILEDECVEVVMNPEARAAFTATELIVPATAEFGGVEYTVTQIGEDGFSKLGCPGNGVNHVKDCVGNITVTLPDGITTIGDNAFMDAHICSINMPASLTTLGECCFRATKLTGTVTLPVGITELPKDAFSWVWTLDRVELPKGLEVIGEAAFNFSRIKEITIPATVSVIRTGAFNGTEYLQKVEVEDLESFMQIECADYKGNVFCSTTSATELIWNNQVVTEIDFGDFSMSEVGNALQGYKKLTKLTFPDYFTYIGYQAFLGCSNIQEVYCKNQEPIECGSYLGDTFDATVYANAILFVPEFCTAAYVEIRTWKNFADQGNLVEMEFEGISDASIESLGLAFVNGEIVNAAGLSVEIYDAAGRLVYAGNDEVIKPAVNGAVIVKCGDKTIKLAL